MTYIRRIAEHSLDRTEDHSIEVEHSSALLSRDYRFGIGIVGKDDKKNISVAKWGPATKAVAQQSYTAIVPKDQDLFCADYDFSTIDKITPTVHAYPNPPKYLTNSLYIGEEGSDRLRVALHSATLCKSDVF